MILGSVVSYVATPQRSAYAAAEHAVRAWADALRGVVGPMGIHVTRPRAKGAQESADASGMAPERAASRIHAGVVAGRREVIVGGREVWSVWVQRHFPAVVARLLPRFAPR